MKKLFVLLCLLSVGSLASTNHRVDSHAPIGIMADHSHKKGEAMISIRTMPMTMTDNYNGSKKISISDIHSSYMMAPKEMTMGMTMVGGMMGLNDKITLTGMIGHNNKNMIMVNQMNSEIETSSNGIGDAKLGAIFSIQDDNQMRLLWNAGLSIPIGSINEKNNNGDTLPYAMQLGSGTYDISLGATAVRFFDQYSIGGQLTGLFRTGKNNHNYRLGNEYQLTTWGQRHLNTQVSATLRSTLRIKTDITGSDTTVSAMKASMSPGYSTTTGAMSGELSVGLNVKPDQFKSSRFAVEYTLPVVQKTDSIAMGRGSYLTAGYQHNL
ncbi:MAG: transporter [Candidatus Marinamargulisbacteria bacterium]